MFCRVRHYKKSRSYACTEKILGKYSTVSSIVCFSGGKRPAGVFFCSKEFVFFELVFLRFFREQWVEILSKGYFRVLSLHFYEVCTMYISVIY